MFKRVEKRRRRKEDEAESGLNEELKNILGFNDTDSDESDSESDSSEAVETDGVERSEEEEEEAAGASQDEDEDDEGPKMSVAQALLDPIFVLSPEVQSCIVCSGKQLKGEKMIQLHRTSNAHERRFKRFKKLAADAEPTDDALEVFKGQDDVKPVASMTASTDTMSKKARKLAAFRERRKLRRKEMLQKKRTDLAENEHASSKGRLSPSKPDKTRSKDTSPSPKQNAAPKTKKRKIDDSKDEIISTIATTSSTPPKALPSPPKKRKISKPKVNETRIVDDAGTIAIDAPAPQKDITTLAEQKKHQDTIIKIARSTAERAKNARFRAAMMHKAGKKIS